MPPRFARHFRCHLLSQFSASLSHEILHRRLAVAFDAKQENDRRIGICPELPEHTVSIIYIY